MDKVIVSRFSEDALADSERIKIAADIVHSDPARRFVIISAPGRQSPEDIKITDMLYMCHSSFMNRERGYEALLAKIQERFEGIVSGLGIGFDVSAEVSQLRKDLSLGRNSDYTVSRGEFIMGKIIAAYLGCEFIDAAEVVYFNYDGTLSRLKTLSASSERLRNVERAVIPGFYGSLSGMGIKTFPRGGGDMTGAIVSRAVNADLLEKWNSTTRIYSADPATVKEPAVIRNMTYGEVLELNYMGIKVFEDDVVPVLQDMKARVLIRSMKHRDEEGTLVTQELPAGTERSVAVCIAGRKNFSVVHIEKFGLNKQEDFAQKLFGIFAKYNVACEHYLSGIHKMSVIIKSPMFDLRRDDIVNDMKSVLKAESVSLEKNLSLIAVIGKGMGTVHGTFERIFYALASHDIKVRMIDQGSDDLSIIIGVYDEDFDAAVNALYEAMIIN